MSFCSLIKGITPKIQMLCFVQNKLRCFETFMCSNQEPDIHTDRNSREIQESAVRTDRHSRRWTFEYYIQNDRHSSRHLRERERGGERESGSNRQTMKEMDIRILH